MGWNHQPDLIDVCMCVCFVLLKFYGPTYPAMTDCQPLHGIESEVLGRAISFTTPNKTNDQWKKKWLFRVYTEIILYYRVIWGLYWVIIGIPMKQSEINGMPWGFGKVLNSTVAMAHMMGAQMAGARVQPQWFHQNTNRLAAGISLWRTQNVYNDSGQQHANMHACQPGRAPSLEESLPGLTAVMDPRPRPRIFSTVDMLEKTQLCSSLGLSDHLWVTWYSASLRPDGSGFIALRSTSSQQKFWLQGADRIL